MSVIQAEGSPRKATFKCYHSKALSLSWTVDGKELSSFPRSEIKSKPSTYRVPGKLNINGLEKYNNSVIQCIANFRTTNELSNNATLTLLGKWHYSYRWIVFPQVYFLYLLSTTIIGRAKQAHILMLVRKKVLQCLVRWWTVCTYVGQYEHVH